MDSPLLTIHIDGAARGNPGPAACAFVIARHGLPAVEEAHCLGPTTNNVAEYTALVRALEHAAALKGKRLLIHSDSELLVKQMNGAYRVKNPGLQGLYLEAKAAIQQFDSVTIRHVRREQNARADFLCNEALDGRPVSAESLPTASARQEKKPPAQRAQEEALDCLRAAATAWRDNADDAPSVEQVWAQLGAILERHGLPRQR